MARITIFTDKSCDGCRSLKQAIQELGIKGIKLVDINQHIAEAAKLKIFGVPTAVINGKKYNISRDDTCLIFKNPQNTVRQCGK